MDVWRLTVAVLRRWYILLPLLALTGVAALEAGQGIRPQYEVAATAMVVPGSTPAEVQNPYGGLDDAAQVLAIVLTSNESRAAIAEQGLNPGYTVAAASRSTIVSFSVQDAAPDVGIATLQAVMAAAADELSSRQSEAGLSDTAQYGIDTLQAPSVSAVVADGKTRIMAIIGLLGAALSFLAAVLFDDIVGLIKRWRRKRRDKRTAQKRQSVSKVRTARESDEAAAPERDGDGGEMAAILDHADGGEPVGELDDDADSLLTTAAGEDDDDHGIGAAAIDERLARAGRDE